MKNKFGILIAVAAISGPLHATTLTFDSSSNGSGVAYGSTVSGLTTTAGVMWQSGLGGANGSHLWLNGYAADDCFTFSSPTLVNSFQMTSLPFAGSSLVPGGNLANGLLIDVAGYNSLGIKIWNTTVNLTGTTFENWVTVDVNTANITKLIFTGPEKNGRLLKLWPSVDNMVINEQRLANVPDAGSSALIFAMGTAALAAFRARNRKQS